LSTPEPESSSLPPGWWQRIRHDLRGAVAPVRLAVQLLRSGRVDAAERVEALAVIDRQVEQLLAAIDDVGDLLRLQAGLPLHQRARQDGNLLLDLVCGRGGLVRGLAARQLRLRCEPCEQEVPFPHDPVRVAALLEFLLLRAAAHAPQEAELVLALRPEGNGAELLLEGAAASLAGDPELRFLLDEAVDGEEPGLRALLMREVLRGNGIVLRHAGDGALALRFSDEDG
jgi:signal transduction histidine kinase